MSSGGGTSAPSSGNVVAQRLPGAPSCALGESPRWHEGAWWWVDVPAGTVFRGALVHGNWVVAPWLEAGERVSMVHPAGPGRMLIARGDRLEIRLISRPDPVERVVAELALAPGWVLNDGIIDARGSIWIGVVAPDAQRDTGWLARVTPDGAVHRSVESVLMSNGLAMSRDRNLLYHADSSRRVVWRHRLADDSTVVESSEFLHFGKDDGIPDGLCLDPAGRLWVAAYGTGEVRCHTDSGHRVATIAIPVPQSTGVWVGGPDGHDVLVTSARESYSASDRRAQPLAGMPFTARLPERTDQTGQRPGRQPS